MKRKPTKPRKVLNPEVLPAEDFDAPRRGKKGQKDLEQEKDDEDAENTESSEPRDSDEGDVDGEDVSDEEAYSSKLPAKTTDFELDQSELKAISPSDPLRRYLEEVRRYPLIDAEHEMALALRLRDNGDIDAAKELVQANLRLVVKIALEYRNFYSNVLDLIQEGNVGLMKAVSKYDPTKGARLGYYASWWIRSYVLKYLLDNFRLVKVGTTQAQKKLFYHLMREKERLEAQGLLAGPKLLAEKLDVREKDVIEMEQRLSGRGAEMSLDTPVNRESESQASHMDLLVDQHEGADEQLARDQLITLLKRRLPEFEKQLNDRELKLLHARLLAEEPKTLQEVADQYGLTRERARQIEAKVVSKLREFLEDDLG
jgi:RNA polymerase sigma-32 factor